MINVKKDENAVEYLKIKLKNSQVDQKRKEQI